MNKREKDKIEEGKEELLKFFEIIKTDKKISEDDFYPLDNKGSSGSIDFKINFNGKETGIELTRFFRHNRKKGSPFSRIEDQCQKLEKFLNDRWKSRIKVGGTLHLKNSHKCPGKKEFAEVLKELSELTEWKLTEWTLSKNKKAHICIGFSNISRETSKTYEQKYPILMKYLNGITIFIDSVTIS